jgi:hypothetical protein
MPTPQTPCLKRGLANDQIGTDGTGLMENRLYPNVDPLGYEGGDSNLFRYVGNGPTIGTDPFGLEDKKQKKPLLSEAQRLNLRQKYYKAWLLWMVARLEESEAGPCGGNKEAQRKLQVYKDALKLIAIDERIAKYHNSLGAPEMTDPLWVRKLQKTPRDAENESLDDFFGFMEDSRDKFNSIYGINGPTMGRPGPDWGRDAKLDREQGWKSDHWDLIYFGPQGTYKDPWGNEFQGGGFWTSLEAVWGFGIKGAARQQPSFSEGYFQNKGCPPESAVPTGPKTSVFHKGELESGSVGGDRFLHTGTNKESVEGLQRPGPVWEFQIPNEVLKLWEQAGYARRRLDFDKASGVYNEEWQFDPCLSEQLNKYKVPK